MTFAHKTIHKWLNYFFFVQFNVHSRLWPNHLRRRIQSRKKNFVVISRFKISKGQSAFLANTHTLCVAVKLHDLFSIWMYVIICYPFFFSHSVSFYSVSVERNEITIGEGVSTHPMRNTHIHVREYVHIQHNQVQLIDCVVWRRMWKPQQGDITFTWAENIPFSLTVCACVSVQHIVIRLSILSANIAFHPKRLNEIHSDIVISKDNWHAFKTVNVSKLHTIATATAKSKRFKCNTIASLDNCLILNTYV